MITLVQANGPCVSNPLQGGAEAEGFGVGVDDEEPTLALRDRVKSSQDLTFVPPLPEGDFQR